MFYLLLTTALSFRSITTILNDKSCAHIQNNQAYLYDCKSYSNDAVLEGKLGNLLVYTDQANGQKFQEFTDYTEYITKAKIGNQWLPTTITIQTIKDTTQYPPQFYKPTWIKGLPLHKEIRDATWIITSAGGELRYAYWQQLN
jgi:hypothetical protein